MSVGTTVEIVPSWERDGGFRREWLALLGRCPEASVTKSPIWLEAWQRIYGTGPGCSPRVLAIRHDGRLIGVAPLILRLRLHRGLVPVRSLEWLGTGEREEHEICSEYVGATAEAGRERAVASSLAYALATGMAGSFDELRLASMAGDSRVLLELYRATIHTTPLRTTRAHECHYVPLPRTFDGYLRSMTSSRRQRLRRAVRKLESWAGHTRLVRAETHAQLALGRTILEALHRERWRAEGKEGAFDAPSFRCFHAQVIPELFDRGEVDILWLEARGRPVAALYNLVAGGRVHFYQSGRATDVPDAVKPGTVVHAYAIENAIERGLHEYDFLAGNTRYKRELALTSRPLLSVRGHGVSATVGARQAVDRGIDLAKLVRERSKAFVAQIRRRGEQQQKATPDAQDGVGQAKADPPVGTVPVDGGV